MATPRLWFAQPLFNPESAAIPYRQLLRHSRPRCNPSGAILRPSRRDNQQTPRVQARSISSSRPCYRTEVSNRYGTANQPPAHLGGGRTVKHKDASKEKKADKETDKEPRIESEPKALPEPKTEIGGTRSPPGEESASALFSSVDTPEHVKDTVESKEMDSNANSVASPAQVTTVAGPTSTMAKTAGQEALSTILAMPPPMSEESQDEHKPPHLQPPRHVHHFDTHTIVKNLLDGTWTEQQAIDVMKAMRLCLADNMSLAREGLLSKADAEMESYLFNAARAELRTELKTSRDSMLNTLRSERNQLQHEVDILSQRITQETNTLKDEVRGMFDDRKMAVRIERRTMDNEIQAMNSKISILLGSEMRSEAEALRWVITRRTVMALVSIILMSLIALRASKYMEDRQARERKAFENLLPGAYMDENGETKLGDGDIQAVASRVEPGDSPGLVSLG